jgi:predicted metallo-beta-lactamase superfamily hydrolase
MSLEIFAAESLGVRGLCCLLTFRNRRIIIDPGVSLGYMRHGLLPHPLQIAEGRRVRDKILHSLNNATDVVFSHFHGDHVPLLDANPYQLSIKTLPSRIHEIRCWSKSDVGLSSKMSKRFHDLAGLVWANMQNAEGLSEGPLSFSQAVPHGVLNSNMGTLMMTRIKMDNKVFVHASDIQLLDNSTVDQVINWQPDIVLAAGPPLYLDRLSKIERECAWRNALRLVSNIDVVILDHHLMRSVEGEVWLDKLSAAVGKKVYCAADFMDRPRQLLEAKRVQLYEKMPVPDGWHDDYAKGLVDTGEYLETIRYQDEHRVNTSHSNGGDGH